MELWIKRFAHIASFSVFFLLFFTGIDYNDMFDFNTALLSFLRACTGAALFWMAGFIIGDIVLKGAVNDIQEEAIDELEGGILQHLKERKKNDVKSISVVEEENPEHRKKKKTADKT